MSFIKKSVLSGGVGQNQKFSSGVESFEKVLINSSIPEGSLITIYQDWPRSNANYANTLLKCLISSAIYSNRPVLIFSSNSNFGNFLETLPRQVQELAEQKKSIVGDNKLKIAHRYKHLLQQNSEQPQQSKIQSFLDLTLPINKDTLEKANIRIIDNNVDNAISISNGSLVVVMDYQAPNNNTFDHLFILNLKKQAKESKSFLFVSTPAYCIESKIVRDVNLISDCVISLSSLTSSPQGQLPEFKDYDGFAKLLKPFKTPIKSAIPDTLTVAFKCRAFGRFLFEPFYLPPDLSDEVSRSCSSINKVDF